MIIHEKKCPMCGEVFKYYDIKHIPDTCGKKMCATNFKYKNKNYNNIDGTYPDKETIKKW